MQGNVDDTIEVPDEQFIRHIAALAREGPIEWQVSEDVREDTTFTDVFQPSNLLHVDTHDDKIILFFETTGTVSERVARSTRWQPAEYKTHDVVVHGELTMTWSADEYHLPETMARVEQDEYPTEPPAPDVDAYRYDL